MSKRSDFIARRAALAALLGLFALCGSAQTPEPRYPVTPIRMLVGYPPGGATDIIARTVAAKLQESLEIGRAHV